MLEKELELLKSLGNYDQVPADTKTTLTIYSWGLQRLRNGNYYIEPGVNVASTMDEAMRHTGNPWENIYFIEIDPQTVTIHWYEEGEHGKLGEVYSVGTISGRLTASLINKKNV